MNENSNKRKTMNPFGENRSIILSTLYEEGKKGLLECPICSEKVPLDFRNHVQNPIFSIYSTKTQNV